MQLNVANICLSQKVNNTYDCVAENAYHSVYIKKKSLVKKSVQKGRRPFDFVEN